MPAPSFSSFPSIAATVKPDSAGRERSREGSPTKRRKRHHDHDDGQDSKHSSERRHKTDGDDQNGRSRDRERDGRDKDRRHREREDDEGHHHGGGRDIRRRRDKEKHHDKDRRRRSETKAERKGHRESREEEPILPADYTPTVPLPTRDESAGFFADTVGSGRGTSQADWRGVPGYRRDTRAYPSIRPPGFRLMTDYILGHPTEVRIDRYKDDSRPGIALRWKRQMDRVSWRVRDMCLGAAISPAD